MHMNKFEIKKENTKAKIKDAFIELLKHKNYDEIDISEICEMAKVNRSTFYRNFNNTDEIIQWYINYIKKESAISFTATKDNFDLYEPTKYILYNIRNNYKICIFIEKCLNAHMFENIFQHTKWLNIYISNMRTDLPTNIKGYLSTAIMSSTISIVQKWVIGGFIESECEIATLLVDFINNTIMLYSIKEK